MYFRWFLAKKIAFSFMLLFFFTLNPFAFKPQLSEARCIVFRNMVYYPDISFTRVITQCSSKKQLESISDSICYASPTNRILYFMKLYGYEHSEKTEKQLLDLMPTDFTASYALYYIEFPLDVAKSVGIAGIEAASISMLVDKYLDLIPHLVLKHPEYLTKWSIMRWYETRNATWADTLEGPDKLLKERFGKTSYEAVLKKTALILNRQDDALALDKFMAMARSSSTWHDAPMTIIQYDMLNNIVRAYTTKDLKDLSYIDTYGSRSSKRLYLMKLYNLKKGNRAVLEKELLDLIPMSRDDLEFFSLHAYLFPSEHPSLKLVDFLKHGDAGKEIAALVNDYFNVLPVLVCRHKEYLNKWLVLKWYLEEEGEDSKLLISWSGNLKKCYGRTYAVQQDKINKIFKAEEESHKKAIKWLQEYEKEQKAINYQKK